MYKHTMDMAKTIGIGIAAGVAVAAISSKMTYEHNKPSRALKRTANKTRDNLTHLLDDVGHMFT